MQILSESLGRQFAFLIVAALMSGCIAAQVGGRPAECTSDGVFLSDPFDSEVDCGWYQYQDDALSGGALISGGIMQISSQAPGQFWWSNPGLDPIEDVSISTVAFGICISISSFTIPITVALILVMLFSA